MNKEFGYVRVAAVVPELRVANPIFNTDVILKEIDVLEGKGVQIALFPELSLTGYTCGDLFLQDVLLEKAKDSLIEIKHATQDKNIYVIVGLPFFIGNELYNCAAVVGRGHILGIVPKTYIPNYQEFYEARWFSSGAHLPMTEVIIENEVVPIGRDLLFQDTEKNAITFGIEICEDAWAPNSPSTHLSLSGATMIFNLSASNEVIGKYEYRKNLLKMLSSKNICGYVYASSGVNESSSDLVFSGFAGIFENGTLLRENDRFSFETNHIIEDVDVERIMSDRRKNKSFFGQNTQVSRVIPITIVDKNTDFLREYSTTPFVPKNEGLRQVRSEEIIRIQASGLAKRMKATGIKKCVLGLSGGLDSTLAFLVIMESFKMLHIPFRNCIAVTMPGFGTSKRTLENSLKLIEAYGVTGMEISIKDASLQHFKDIGLDASKRDVTYENTQARERTQILMDLANLHQALVIGTGDLSELVLGWCTYNGDHMSMYAVNTSIPKTLVRYLVQYFVEKEEDESIKKTLQDILDTPISPELLPPDAKGNITQKTESVVGPYLLHDFTMYHFLRYGASPKKIEFLENHAFQGMYSKEEIHKWLDFFFRRFFSQQFKRNCMPDGVKVGTISVSPRGDLRVPSDADASIWRDFS